MRTIRLKSAVIISVLLTAACSTVEPNAITRGAPCDHLGQIAAGEHDAPLVCNETAAGSASSADAKGVWGVIGIDKPITAKGVPNANCAHTGELAVAKDGSILRCVWNNPDLTPSNNAVAGHAN
jgi:hypothetical protein